MDFGCGTYLGKRQPLTSSEEWPFPFPIEQWLHFFHHSLYHLFRGGISLGLRLRTPTGKDVRQHLGDECVGKEIRTSTVKSVLGPGGRRDQV